MNAWKLIYILLVATAWVALVVVSNRYIVALEHDIARKEREVRALTWENAQLRSQLWAAQASLAEIEEERKALRALPALDGLTLRPSPR